MTQYISDKISILHRVSASELDKKLCGMGLTRSQASFIISVCEKKGQPQERLAERLHMDKGAAARSIKQLEDAGYVTRICCKNDKRRRCVFPTEKAIKAYDDVKVVFKEWDDNITEGFTPLEKDILTNILGRLAENALCDKSD